MKVKELIELLSKTDPEREVVQFSQFQYVPVNCAIEDRVSIARQYSWEKTDVVCLTNADIQYLKDTGFTVIE